MKIVYLAAGAGGMYCGSCLHDNTLAAALLDAGHDVLLVPTYTPLRTDEPDVSQRQVMFGGINVYLQQKSALFRHTPWFVDRWLDSPWLLDRVSSSQASVDPAQLGDLTLSMLRGEAGNQRKELVKLVRWLADDVKPEIVHLSNSMLAGMAREIRRHVNAPIVCSLSGEDIFIEKLRSPYYEQVREELRSRARDVDAFVALNRYFADFMADYAAIDPRRIRVIPHGLNLAGHGTRRAQNNGEPPTVGYFARICHEKGLHQLVEAFCILSADPSLPPLRLRAAGYMAPGDRPYLAAAFARAAAAGLENRVEYVGELDRAGKIEFLQSLAVMSLPTVYRESKGLSVLESLANAVPAVLPDHGAFPELIADTGGGLLHRPGDSRDLAAALKRMIQQPDFAAQCGTRGQAAIRSRFTAAVMARQTADLYRSLIDAD